MTIDASFEKIIKIVPHKNADSLEIAIVSNYPCIVRKNTFNEGDCVFYIRDDAELVEYENRKNITGDTVKFSWQIPLLGYLGANGRVKPIKLRGVPSMGILLDPKEVLGDSFSFDENIINEINSKIKDETDGKTFLEEKFGIRHWYNRNITVGKLDVKCQGLEDGVPVSDEDNWEQIKTEDYDSLHIGKMCIVTKKMDGSSTTVICRPDGSWSVASRRQTFKNVDLDNVHDQNAYQRLTVEVVKAGLWWANKHQTTIALRGECCGDCFNRTKVNKDCRLNKFYLYGCYFPEESNFFLKRGIYGTENHFLEIAKELNVNGFFIDTVEVLENDVVVTESLLQKYNDMPSSFGEGVVINIKIDDINSDVDTVIWSYKAKSRDYLMKLG